MHVAAQQIATRRFIAAIRSNRYFGVHKVRLLKEASSVYFAFPAG